jgi:hypothetical protein
LENIESVPFTNKLDEKYFLNQIKELVYVFIKLTLFNSKFKYVRRSNNNLVQNELKSEIRQNIVGQDGWSIKFSLVYFWRPRLNGVPGLAKR